MWSCRPLGWVSSIALALALWLAPGRASAAEPPSRVSVLTMGPGDHPFTRFGHNAILLEWDDLGPQGARVYNYGTFAFDGMNGVRDFMTGRFRYWLSVTNLASTLRAYGRAQRSLTAQELALSAEERARLFEALEQNELPEHRYYDYDYYADNCSTRVRDAVDRVLGGQLQASVHGAGRYTFRQHTLRLVADAPLLSFGLDVALGRPTDRPISRWEELFLPQELHDELAQAKRADGAPLVLRERELLHASRPALATEPPNRTLGYGLLGAAVGGLLLVLGHLGRSSRAARRGLGAVGGLLGIALGLLGVALAIFTLSKHSAAHLNPSLLAVSPLALGVGWSSLRLLRSGAPTLALERWLLAATLACSLLLVASMPSSGRESLRMLSLFWPFWLGWLLAARRLRT